MIALQTKVVHLGITLVANAVHGVVCARQLTPLVAASLTDCTAAALAVLLRVSVEHFELACEGRLTDLAGLSVDHLNVLDIEGAGQ